MLRFLVRVVSIVALAAIGAWVFAERGRLMRRSTWRVIREGGWRRLRDRTFFHTYVYGRFPKEYIGHILKHRVRRFSPQRRRRAADYYHGKVVPIELATSIVTVDRPIAIPDLEQVIPYATARELVLNGPPEVVAFECPCRMRKAEHCQPTQVCMIVGQPFADFMLEHHPARTRRLTTGEAVALLEAEHARGHVHTAYFKDVMLNRFYAICNCCPCCCGAFEAMQHGIPMVTSSGYLAQPDAGRCRACGACERACPFDAIHVNGTSRVRWEACMGCGVCVAQCPHQAITLVRDDRKGIPLDVRRL